MNISRSLKLLCSKALTESMDVRTMEHIVRRIIPGYNLHRSTGFPESFSIPNRDAAQAIISDIVGSNLFLTFVEELISIQNDGIMSRTVNIAHLKDIVKEIYNEGYIFDDNLGIFVENPRIRKTRNWGILQEGKVYTFAFLGIDIMGNTNIVKKYPKDIVETTYTEFSYIVQNITEKRNGRLWAWEGDGGVIAFYRGNKYQDAVLSSIEIINDLFLYNRTMCRLKEKLHFRISIHSGECEYTGNMDLMSQLEPVKVLVMMEKKYSWEDSVCISLPVRMMLDGYIAEQFRKVPKTGKDQFFRYSLRWENG